ncbi:helix-turn-helix domain-containing protein [Marinobacter sp. F3R08]|uniref:response regulator transcription factor n=1 Tax=Marinobacter sp. F3R08 TaxID=2841559 RepID=UPI001C088B7B|nr:DNA-binding response regulator [Marinobacter sp. F3R08]MBU2954820.1 DNA-binding response regulator [Marinobacter sp. F3R08]
MAPRNTRSRILIVDDCSDDVRPALLAMSAREWHVSVANDARQGLRRARLLRPDLILLDVHMPHMDGFTFCRLLREDEVTRSIPVIFLTSAGALDERLEGLQLGGVDYIVKPYEPLEVLARMRVHLRLRQNSPAVRAEGDSASETDDEMVVRAAIKFLSQNLGALPSLPDIARTVGTHDKRLSRLFREHMGMTVFACVREMRLKKSQELLSDTDMSVQEIAERLGFSSAGNFTTTFRKQKGLTPTEFREQINGQ